MILNYLIYIFYFISIVFYNSISVGIILFFIL